MGRWQKKGILFDSTLCIGCGGCYEACKERNRLPRTTGDFLRDDLSAQTYTVVKRRQGRFVRQLCMHCEVPACASVCPTGATRFGDRDGLIEKAHARMRAHPKRYIRHIYGLEEVGGTSVLLLSDVPMERLGYRTPLSRDPLPLLTWIVLKKIPNFVAVGGVLLYGIWWITNRRIEVQRIEREREAEKKGEKEEEEPGQAEKS